MSFDVKRFDIYRKVPKDLTQPTLTGAIISIICCFSITVLIISEFNRFITTDVISEVYVDNPGQESSERIPVLIEIELFKLECKHVGLDIQDDMGRHEVGFVENTEKKDTDTGGCVFKAKFFINKVPGNFHVSTHSSGHHSESLDFAHKITKVAFGEKIKNEKVPGSFNPLGGVSKSSKEEMAGYESHDYIMKIVPTVYEENGKDTISYQYTYAYRSFSGRSAAIWFRYDLSPLTVKYKVKGEPFFSFLTAVCAVVGGVFTVANMIDGILFSASEYVKKLEIGKLS